MDPDSKRVASTGLIAFFSCFVVTLLLVGWDAVEVATWGLKCNKLSKTCEDQSNRVYIFKYIHLAGI